MTFKILSLDGGGMRGVISARILKDIEKTIKEKYGQELHEYFDLIAGTSTGSILAAGIACQMTAQELINLYKEEGENIFLKKVRDQRKRPRFISKFFFTNLLYPHKSVKQGLANVLERKLIHNGLGKCPSFADINSFSEDKKLKKLQLLILSYDVLSRNTTWFANDDPTEWFYKNNLPLWQICTASASAPTFFPPYELKYSEQTSLPHIDGGVSANNPVLAAIAHALSMTSDKKPSNIGEIAVLSIGTGKTTYPYTYAEVKKWGQLGWARHLPDMFLDPDAENSEYIAKRLFRGIGRQKYLRLNFEVNKSIERNIHPTKLRNHFKKTYNQYIYYKTQEKVKVCEDIDNPETYKQLLEAAQYYLDSPELNAKDEPKNNVTHRQKIEEFIYNHPPDPKKADLKDSNGLTTQSKQLVTN